MEPYRGLDKPKGPGYFIFWKCFFFAMVAGFLLLVWYAASQVEYVWHWNRIPSYFWVIEDKEIHSELEGEVAEIAVSDEGNSVLTVRGDDGREESHLFQAADTILVSQGDYVYRGDTLGRTEYSHPGIFLVALWVTLKVSILAILAGTVIGLLTGLARISENPALRWASVVYIELIRGSPLLVQIYLWYFVLGKMLNDILAVFGVEQVSELTFGVLALAIFVGAYVAEIVRAGIQGVHRGQMEAARSLGLSYSQAMRKVILPQAFRHILPPLAGQFISLIKDSSLLGVISVRELTKATREIVTSSLQPFEMWITCAVLYLILTFSLSLVVKYLERREAR